MRRVIFVHGFGANENRGGIFFVNLTNSVVFLLPDRCWLAATLPSCEARSPWGERFRPGRRGRMLRSGVDMQNRPDRMTKKMAGGLGGSEGAGENKAHRQRRGPDGGVATP